VGVVFEVIRSSAISEEVKMIMRAQPENSGFRIPPTWEEIYRWNEILHTRELDLIRELLKNTPKEKSCPYLRNIEEEGLVSWIFCEANKESIVKEGIFTKEVGRPSYTDPRYHACCGSAEIQLFCLTDFTKCIYYIDHERGKEQIRSA
jgi:hypothetical protein